MRLISGVGDVKLERYGEDFLAEIRSSGDRGITRPSAAANAKRTG
jgi:hypothetical protein